MIASFPLGTNSGCRNKALKIKKNNNIIVRQVNAGPAIYTDFNTIYPTSFSVAQAYMYMMYMH